MMNDTFSQSLTQLFQRDLLRLRKEVEQQENESILWAIEKNIANSAGNLALHLVGNLNHFIGAQMGNTGYVRRRPDEFGLKNVSKVIILQQIDDTIKMVESVLPQLTEAFLATDCSRNFAQSMDNRQFLMHLYGHLNYHLGQINYHRRLL